MKKIGEIININKENKRANKQEPRKGCSQEDAEYSMDKKLNKCKMEIGASSSEEQ